MTFSEFIKQKRLQADITQQQATDKLGFDHRSYFHRLETGQIEWKLKHIQGFAELLEITPSELLNEFENLR